MLINETTEEERRLLIPAVEVTATKDAPPPASAENTPPKPPLISFGNDKLRIKGKTYFDNYWLEGVNDGAHRGGMFGQQEGYENGGKQILFATVGVVTLPFTLSAGGITAMIGSL